MHDGTIGLDGSPRHIVILFEVYDNNFGGCSFVLLLSDADEGVGLECLMAMLVIAQRQGRGASEQLTQVLKPIEAG